MFNKNSHKLRDKLIHITMIAGLAISYVGPTTISLFTGNTAYAKDNKASKDTKSGTDNKDKKGLSKVDKLLFKQANIYNAGVPAGAQTTYTNNMKYNKDMQVLITYSILKNKYGDTSGKSYNSLYSNSSNDNGSPQDLISSFNKQKTGIKIPNSIGNQKMLKDLSQFKMKKNKMSLASQAASGTPDGENKDNANSDNNGDDSEVKKIANKLADNTLKATGLSNDRDPSVVVDSGQTTGNDGLSDDKSGWMNTGHELMDGIKSVGLNSGNYSGATLAVYNDIDNYTTTSQKDKKYHDSLVNYYISQIKKRYINNNADKSGKEIAKKLKNISVEDIIKNKDSFNIIYKDINIVSHAEKFMDIGTGHDSNQKNNGILLDGNANKDNQDAKAKKQTQFLNVAAVYQSGDKYGTVSSNKWNKNFMKYFEMKNNTDINENKINKTQKKNNKAVKDNKESVGNDAVIGWNWLSPTSEYFKANTDSKDHFDVSGNNLLYTNSHDPVQLSTNALQDDDKGKTGKEFNQTDEGFGHTQNDTYASLNGKQNKDLQGSVVNIQEKQGQNANSNIKRGWKTTFNKGQFGKIGANDEVVGYDTYGNLIDGEKGPNVIIPYWQNFTTKQFNDPTIAANANMNDDTGKNFNYGDKNQFKGANKAVKAFGGDNDFASKIENGQNSWGSSASDYVKGLNEAAGNGSSGTMKDGTAAKLAVVISAMTQDQVKDFNKKMIAQSKDNSELYVGKSKAKSESSAKKGGKGTYLYTATDIIQRAGLQSDNGYFDGIHKTIVGGLVNTYNNGFIQSGQQDIFHTTVFSETSMANNINIITICEIASAFLGAIWLWILFNYVRGNRDYPLSKFITSSLKLLFIFMIISVSSSVYDLMLNKPGEVAIQQSLDEQSVLDQWNDLRQQQSINNPLYSSLFGDSFSQINNSQSYTLKFYTTSIKGSSAQDTDNNKGPNPKAVDDKTSNSNQALQNMTANQKAQLNGNGKAGLLAPFQYKTVNIAANDVLSWAIHMDRQIETQRQKQGKDTGFQNSSTSHEEPNDGYQPGQTPLFVWLDKFYTPLGTNANNKKGLKNTEYGTTVKGSSYGSGDSAYGKRRNPADSSQKSAYKTDLMGKQENDNGSKYKGLSKYTEYAVNTKHYASSLDKQYGIDQDSNNKADTNETDNKSTDASKNGTTMLTASDLFLRIWVTTFMNQNANQNSTKNATDNAANDGQTQSSVKNYIALSKFAAALRGIQMDDSLNSDGSSANDSNMDQQTQKLLQQNIGATGRKDLIDELSMTKVQRKAIAGGDGTQFSSAASDVINAYDIPKPTNDWLALDNDNSPLDVIHPYYGTKQHDVRDGLINSINKEFLNNYVNTYSTVRFSLPNATSGANDSNGNENGGDMDSFTMAETQEMALDLFFVMNKQTGQTMFPKEFTPQSISLDTWNRMLLIPIGEMTKMSSDGKQAPDDSSQYDKNQFAKNEIAMQDNVAEYIGLNTNIISMVMFIIMNMMLIIFGKILSLFVVFGLPILTLFSLFKSFIKPHVKIFSILVGSLGAVAMLGIMKLILTETYAWMSQSMNNSYINNNGNINLPVFQNCFIISLELFLFFWFILKIYIPAVKNDLTGFGASNGIGSLLGNLKSNSRSAWGNSLANKAFNGTKRLARNSGKLGVKTLVGGTKLGLKGLYHAPATLASIAGHTMNIGTYLKKGTKTSGNFLNDLHTRGIANTWDKYKNSFMESNFHKNHEGILSRKVNNLKNAYYGARNTSGPWGISKQEIADAESGELLKTVKDPGKLSLSVPSNYTEGQKAALAEVIKELPDVQMKNGKLLIDNATEEMLKDPESRKKLLDPIIQALGSAYHTTGEMLLQSPKQILPTYGSMDGDDISVGVGEGQDISTRKVKSFIASMKDKGFELANSPIVDANGNYASNQKLQFKPVKDMDSNTLHKFFSGSLQRMVKDNIAPGARENAYDMMANLGTTADARRVAAAIPDAKVVGTNVLVRQGDKLANEKLNAEINDRNMTAKNDIDAYKKMAEGMSDYSVNGAGHGFSEDAAKFVRDPNKKYIAEFKSNDVPQVKQLLNNMKDAANNYNFMSVRDKAMNSALNWDKAFAAHNDNNIFKQTQSLQNALHDTGSSKFLDADQRNAISRLNNLSRNTSFDALSDKQKADVSKTYNKLFDSLRKSPSWNNIQSTISNNSGDAALKVGNEKQQQLRNDLKDMVKGDSNYLNNLSTTDLANALQASAAINRVGNTDNTISIESNNDDATELLQKFMKDIS